MKQASVLLELLEKEGDMTSAELSAATGIPIPSVSATLHDLFKSRSVSATQLAHNRLLYHFLRPGERPVVMKCKRTARHGTTNMYRRHRCRCEACRAVHARVVANWSMRKKERQA